jgi:2-iminoacetate synthase
LQIINEKYIFELIEKYVNPDSYLIDEIIEEAKLAKGLSLEQVAALINVEKNDDLNKIFTTANQIKKQIYGKRVVFFAPLYISNFCTNNCLYCGFRIDNKEIERVALTQNDIHSEVIEILNQGHKRILLLIGEHSKKSSLEYLIQSIDTIYSCKNDKDSNIRRINIEIEPLENEEFKIIKDIPIGTYTVFQETYHKPTYEKVHISGKKSDYHWRLEVMHRALSNGLPDVGIGALFGLFDYRFEVLGLISHSKNLEKEFNIGPHTISIPRLQYAQNAPYSLATEYAVSAQDFKKLVAVLRLAVPYTGMILSTRESSELRMELLNLGISQISAGSRTNPGGYKQAFNEGQNAQFHLNDSRTSGEVIRDIIELGFIPSFCTSCYQVGRVGEKFMEITKQGDIKTFCQPNALLTLKEYLNDYADKELQEKGNQLINSELDLFSPNEKETTKKLLQQVDLNEKNICL